MLLVIVYEYILENKRLYFTPLHSVRRNPVQKLFLQGGKETFHPGIIETVVNTGKTLKHTSVLQLFPESLAGELAASGLNEGLRLESDNDSELL